MAGGFLDLRTAFPLVPEHTAIPRSLLDERRTIDRLLDVGCGDGFVTAAVQESYPSAHAVMVDFSRAMLDRVPERVTGSHETHERDLMDPGWADDLGRFDAVVSGNSPDICLHR